LAALDLILSPEWEHRYYSFNALWAPGQAMASMRNGCGDEWFCLFHSAGWAALKGLDHESRAWREGNDSLCEALRTGIPTLFADFSCEPAFRWDVTSFLFYCSKESQPWVRAIEETAFAELPTDEDLHLSLLVGHPADYVNHAADYFEKEIDERVVALIFSLAPLTPDLALTLNPDLDWSAVTQELFSEIGYPNHKAR
jgi:hypothetical protein